MKKILAVIMSALLILTAFAACSRSGEGNNTAQGMTESAANAKYKVYLITIDKMDQHWVSVDKGASDMAKQLGITYKWYAPDVKDNAKQIEAVNNAIADGASLIMLAANDPSAISQTVKNAKDKGVKIIYVDSPANEPAVTTLSTDNYNAGMIAGETMLEELKNAGITSGKIGIIGVNTATNSSMNREKGFREAITKDGKFTLLTTEYKDGNFASSQEAATGFITGNSDLVGLYGTNEGSTVGVGNAIKDSGKKIIGIGFDTSNTIESLINDGSLKAVMVQNPYTMGYLGMAQALAALLDDLLCDLPLLVVHIILDVRHPFRKFGDRHGRHVGDALAADAELERLLLEARTAADRTFAVDEELLAPFLAAFGVLGFGTAYIFRRRPPTRRGGCRPKN